MRLYIIYFKISVSKINNSVFQTKPIFDRLLRILIKKLMRIEKNTFFSCSFHEIRVLIGEPCLYFRV